MRKFYFICLLFIIFIMMASVSAGDVNSTNDLNYQFSNSDPLIVEDNDEDINSNIEDIESIKEVDNDNLKDTYSTNDSYSFDDLDDWSSTGSVSLSDEGYEGSCVVLNAASISRDIDWSYVDKIGFWYKIPSRAGTLTVYVGDQLLTKVTATQPITEWTHFEQNVSFTGVQNLKFQATGNNRQSYIDSLILTLKPVNDSYSFDDLDDWSSTGSVSLSDEGYEGSCVVLNAASISRDIDWSYVDKIGFWYKIPSRAGTLTVYVGDQLLTKVTATQPITEWTHFEQNVSFTGVQNLKFQATGNNRQSYIDSLILTFNYTKEPVKELVQTKLSYILNNSNVIISLKDLEDNPIQGVDIAYTINGGNIISNVTNDDGQIVIGNIIEDILIFASFAENEDYLASNITVKISSTKLTINSTESSIVISLRDSENNPISGAGINYSVNDDNLISAVTNNQGQIIVRDVIGGVVIFASYSGNDKKYLKTNATENCYVGYFDGNPFTNPYFDEGDLNELGNVYGWNVTAGAAHDGSTIGGMIVGNNRVLSLTSNYYGYHVSQYINFDCIDKIFFKYYATNMGGGNFGNYNLTTFIGGTNVESSQISRDDGWQDVIIDVKDFNGYNSFELYLPQLSGTGGTPYAISFDDFEVSFNDKMIIDFTQVSSLEEDNISVKFTNNIIGNITNVMWEFGDGEISHELNPTHLFKPGKYNVTLTVYHGETSLNQTYLLSFDYPSIDGKMYATVQDAINDAESGAVIDIPNDFSENLTISKNVTLNFNGNKLTSSNSPLISVVNGADVTVNNISLSGDSNVFAVDETSKLTIKDSTISDAKLELQSGNITVTDVALNNAQLTINAKTTLTNVNTVNTGVIIVGGKSKIAKSAFIASDVAIVQTGGELELINNIIKDNNVALNITTGSATISLNAIYNNTSLNINESATVTNNWFGTNQVTGFDSYLRLVITAPVSEMYPGEEYTITAELVPNTGSLEGSIDNLTLEFTSSNGETTPVTINNNNGEFKFTAGQTTDEVKLTLFNEEYTLVNGETPVSIVTKPLDTNIAITSPENGVVVITLTTSEGNVSGANISYTINGGNKVNNITDANGQIIIKDLTGKVSINVTYDGNKTLNPSAGNNVFDFIIATVISASDVSTTYGVAKELIITLTANGNALANKTINVAVGTINKNLTTDASGQVSVDVSGLNPNTYVANIAFAGDVVYIKSNATANVVVNKVATSLSAPAVSATYNVAKNLVITLTANGKALEGQKVTVKVGTISKTLTTDAKGQVSVAISSLVPKTYTATISFAGDKIYTASSTNAKVVVVKAKSAVTAKKATFKAKKKTKKYTITLKAGKKAISKVKVTLKVKGKTYKATTNAKGKATFKINKLTKKGKHTATIKFAGNKYYKASTKKVKLTVK